MIGTIYIIHSILLVILAIGGEATTNPPVQLTWCRMNEGVSRCVDPPFKKNKLPKDVRERLEQRASGNWCPFRVCGPSYMSTDACPADDDFKPTGQCSVTTISSKVNACLRGFTDYLPEDVACDVLGSKYCGVGPVYVCKCNSRSMRQVVYELENLRKPVCST